MAIDRKLMVNDEPTIWNKEMAIGTLLLPIIGTVIGGYIGKNRMRQEKAEGRTVTNEPSGWNKDTLLGGLIGTSVGGVVGSILAAVAIGTFGPAGAIAAHGVGLLAGMIVGGSIGAKFGKDRQLHDYEQSVEQDRQHTIKEAMGRSPSRDHSHGKGKDYAPVIENERLSESPGHHR